jgi:uncharacterized protein YcsI (UPF0317 family)
MDAASLTGAEARRLVRRGECAGTTSGMAAGYAQANVVILPETYAVDFERFCGLNPKPCPLLGRTAPGDPHPTGMAQDADLRYDVPLYRVYRDGKLAEERTEIAEVWRDDLVGFLLGCSFSFEQALIEGGVPVRHIEMGCTVPMFCTSIACEPAGRFAGPLVVTMRPVPDGLVDRAVEITSRYPMSHGAPVHIGDPAAIGIADLAKPDYGDPVPVRDRETPVFWACGVTPQAALEAARLPLAITHAPGRMFITDLPA